MTEFQFDFRRFFDLSPDLLCIAGFDGYFRKVNPGVSKVLGYSEEELYSRPIDDFVHEEDRAITAASRNRVIESETLFHFENRYVTKSGDIVWLSWTSQRIEEDRLVFAVAKNITVKKQLESERSVLLEDLERVNHELKQFSLTSSHDLRSPLSNLIMVFDMLDVSRISDPETQELVEMLQSTGDNLKKSLNAYVDILTEDVGRRPEPETLNLQKCLDRILPSIHSLVKTSGAVIESDFSGVESVWFDRRYLESVFMNLISNSIKYARPGIPPRISIRAELGDGETRLVFEDNGSGIDMAEAKDRLFKINQTFHDRRDSKGVGLYLVHSQVTRLGGRIQVRSKVNVGTCFTITFPLHKA